MQLGNISLLILPNYEKVILPSGHTALYAVAVDFISMKSSKSSRKRFVRVWLSSKVIE